MSFDISDLPIPENRTADQWVTYYLRLENAVAQGESISVNGRSVTMPDLSTIVRRRKEWQVEAASGQSKADHSTYTPVVLG